jgi:ABC-type multidrug transport system fused ATPase/permease subunit
LLILDEATSALDGQTESELTDAIQQLHGSVTVVVIAHRLTTIRNADLVVYLENGNLMAQGTFDDVRRAIPNFNHQAMDLGLQPIENELKK